MISIHDLGPGFVRETLLNLQRKTAEHVQVVFEGQVTRTGKKPEPHRT